MSILKDVILELFGMFVADRWLTAALLLVVAVTAVLTTWAGIDPLLGGAVLLVGCLLVLLGSVRRAARG